MDYRFQMDTPAGRLAHLQCELGEAVGEAGRCQRWGGVSKWPPNAGKEVLNNMERLMMELWDVQHVGQQVVNDLVAAIGVERVLELRADWELMSTRPAHEKPLTAAELMAEALGIDARETAATAASADAYPCGTCHGSGYVEAEACAHACMVCDGSGFLREEVA